MPKSKLVLLIGLAFLFGIFAASLGWSIYKTAALAALAALIYNIFRDREIRYTFHPSVISRALEIIVIAIVIVTSGFFYYHFYLNFTEARQDITFNQKIKFSGIVINDPFITDYQSLTIKLDPPQGGKIKVLTSLAPKFEYGDRLKFEGKIEPSADRHLLPISFFPKIELIEKHQGSLIKEKLLDLKRGLISQFRKFLSPDSAALISGETFGHRADFTKEFKEQMNLSGTTHIVALSGYNIAILVIAIAAALGSFLSRRKTFIITVVVIILFVIMVGGEASVVRAAIMGFLLLLGKELGRPPDTFRIILLTAIIMILFNPAILRFDIGFQLSFMSLLGIIYLEPALRKFFKIQENSKSFLGWRENALMTLSAQAFVAPIIIQNFNQFSLAAIPANILILEVVPLTMFLGFLLSGLGSLLYVLGFLIAKLAAILLIYQIAIIKLFSLIRLPISNTFASWGVFIVYYLILIGLIIYSFQKSESNVIAP